MAVARRRPRPPRPPRRPAAAARRPPPAATPPRPPPARPTTRRPRTRPTRRPRRAPRTRRCRPASSSWPPGSRRSGPTSSTTSRSPGRASRPTWPTPSPAPWASPRMPCPGCARRSTAPSSPAPRTSTSTCSSTRSTPTGRRSSPSAIPTTRRTRRSSAPPTRPPRRPPRPSDFRQLKIGVAAGTTSLTFVQDVLKPTSDPFVYNDNAAAKQAIDTKQIDAIVVDLPTGIYIARRRAGGRAGLRAVHVDGQRRRTVGHVVRQGQPAPRVRQRGAGDAAQGRHPRRHHRALDDRGRRHPRHRARGEPTTSGRTTVPAAAVVVSTRHRRHRFEHRQRQRSVAIAVYSTVIVRRRCSCG